MEIGEITSLSNEYEAYESSTHWPETATWNSREVNLENTQAFAWIPQKIHTNAASFVRPMANSYGGTASGSTDTEGTTHVEGEGHISHTTDDGSTTTKVEVSGGVEIKPDGSVFGEAKIQISCEKEFNLLKA